MIGGKCPAAGQVILSAGCSSRLFARLREAAGCSKGVRRWRLVMAEHPSVIWQTWLKVRKGGLHIQDFLKYHP